MKGAGSIACKNSREAAGAEFVIARAFQFAWIWIPSSGSQPECDVLLQAAAHARIGDPIPKGDSHCGRNAGAILRPPERVIESLA